MKIKMQQNLFFEQEEKLTYRLRITDYIKL